MHDYKLIYLFALLILCFGSINAQDNSLEKRVQKAASAAISEPLPLFNDELKAAGSISDFSTERSVQLSANVENNSTSVSLEWLNDGTADSYAIYKRQVGSGSGWGNVITTLEGSASGFTDENIVTGIIYEYQVVKSGSTTGYGYVVSGIEAQLPSFRGIFIMVIENSYMNDNSFVAAIDQTVQDIEMDGWKVEKIEVNRDESVTSVKQKIKEIYNRNTQNTKALYLVGHVPVPYSGLINPDGHPDHRGAWPADVYYGNFQGEWTDRDVNEGSQSVAARNRNIPGDGKFDQSYTPGDVVLQIGRVDFVRQYLFDQSEKDLLIEYLNKAHRYKTGEIKASDQGLVDDNFSSRSDGFASSGYRNFAPFFGTDNVHANVDFVQGTRSNSYMWAYGCGGGSYQNCSGVASTQDFSDNDLQIIFSMLFGSYFGDWDSDNNLLRAAIGQGHTLATAWAGRPHWHFYHMAMGTNIGYAALITQNNNGDYFPSTRTSYNRMVHIALLGDPSLRMHYPEQPAGLEITEDFSTAVIRWNSPSESVDGYYIFRKHENETGYKRITSIPVTGTEYQDNSATINGNYSYVVKSVNIQHTSSGSYFNESLGIAGSVNLTVGIEDTLELNLNIYPNPSDGIYNLDWSGEMNYNNLNITIYTYDGRQIKSIVTDASKNSYTLDLNKFPKGIYIMKVWNDVGLTFTRQLVKL